MRKIDGGWSKAELSKQLGGFQFGGKMKETLIA